MDQESGVSLGEYINQYFVPTREPENTGNEYFDEAFSSTWDFIKAIRGIVQMIALSISYLFMRLRQRRKIKQIPEKPGTMPDPAARPPVVVPIMPV